MFRLIFLKSFWNTLFELWFIWYVKKFRKYYTHIDYLPLFNFAEIMKGNLNYFYVKNIDRKVPEIYFLNIFQDMHYQFKILDNSNLRDIADLARYESEYVSTGIIEWKRKHDTLKAKIKTKEFKSFNLDDFTDYIEHTYKFAPGSIDTKKISTAKAYSNYHKAIEHNRKLVYANN